MPMTDFIKQHDNRDMEQSEPEKHISPFYGLIQRVESYMANPKMVTPETLKTFRDELLDLKGAMDIEDDEDMEGEYDKGMPVKDGMNSKPSIMIAFGHTEKGEDENAYIFDVLRFFDWISKYLLCGQESRIYASARCFYFQLC